MSPAVATGGGGQQQMPPRPPSGNQPTADQSKMASAAPPQAPSQAGPPSGGGPPSGPPGGPPGSNYSPQHPQGPMGPPPHMMYNNKGGPPPGGPQQMPPGGPQQMPPGGPQQMPHGYGGGPPGGQQPPPGNYYGMRMGGPGGYGHPGQPGQPGYPGAYGRQNNIPSGYPGQHQQYGYGGPQQMPPGAGQQPQGMGPPGAMGQRPAHYPPRPQHPSMPMPQQMGKGGYPGPNSYNGPPRHNGPSSGPGGPPGGPPGQPPGMQPPSNSGYPPASYPNQNPNSAPPTPHGYPPNTSVASTMPPASTQGSGPTPPTSSSAPSGGPPPPSSGGTTGSSASGPVGPDGFDESSQQSTLSQSSDRSDGRQTPKGQGQTGPQHPQQAGGGPAQGHPHNFMGNFGHGQAPGSPHSSAPSPGGSMGSSGAGPDGGYPRDGMASPSWQRPPASPVSTPQMNNFTGSGSSGPPAATAGTTAQGTTKKTSSRSSDSLSRLYEMDDHPDRRPFLEKLLSFMEEKGTAITQCPTISKNPLDLFRLYLYTKERGGYLECTKQKTWKDIAAQLGIGASSSGAYTLKKHYGKNLLPFECYYDRGGIDPAPILAQVEAQTKKKAKAPTQPPPAPSPGSQDSRDSYSNSNSNASAADHYGAGYPPAGGPGGYNNYPPHNSGGPPGPPQGPPPPNSADGRPPSHPGMPPGAAGYPPNSSYGGYPPPPHNRPDAGPYPGSGGGYPPAQRPGWPPHQGYGPPPTNGGPPPPNNAPPQGADYRQGYYGPRPGGPGYPPGGPQGYPPGGPQSGPPQASAGASPATSTASSGGPPNAPGGPPPNQNQYGQQPPYHDQYQPKPGQPGQQQGGPPGPPPGPPGSLQPPPPHTQAQSPGPPNSAPSVPASPAGPPKAASPVPSPVGAVSRGSTPPPPGPPGSRPPLPPGMLGPRPPGPPHHPGAPPQSYGTSSSPSTSSSGPPGPPTPQGYPVRSTGPQSQPPQRPPGPGGAPPSTYSYPGQRPPMYPGSPTGSWQNRYPSQSGGYPVGDSRSWGPQGAPPRMPPGAPGPQGWSSGPPGSAPGPSGPGERPNYPYGGQGMPWRGGMRPPYRPDMRGGPQVGPPGMMGPGGRPPYPGQRGSRGFELSYPPGSVEATQPLMMKRRKYTKVDVQPVDGWRLVMALRSGLLMESTWALDVINILLFDDYTVAYFGLGNMPGLLEALLEHWRASLIAMFGVCEDLEVSTEKSVDRRTRKRQRVLDSAKSKKWYEPGRDLELHKTTSRLHDEAGEDIDIALGRVPSDLDLNDKSTVLINKTSYTKRPRFSDEDVEVIDRDETLFVNDDERDWDDGVLMTQGSALWENGGGRSTDHIATHFASDLGLVPFVKLLEDLGSQLKKEPEESATATPTKSKPKENGIAAGGSSGVKLEPEDDEEPKEDIINKIKRLTGITVRDPDLVRQRWKEELLEDENFVRDEPSLHLVSEANDSIGKRAVCLSTIFRNLSFVPGNEYELSNNGPFLAICGRLLLLKHWHPPRNAKKKNYDRGEDEETIESCTSLTGDDEWWWEYLHVIRENVMVALSNISGSLHLYQYSEDIARPIFHGLLEWAVSTSAYAQDPFPNVGPHSPISPQGLAIETLCKLCLHEANVDLMLTTPPYRRIEKLTLLLARKLNRYENQVLREFSINLLYYLSAADTGVARTIATSDLTIGLLLGFIEQAEQNAMVIAQKHGVNALRDNPDSMGTSLDMMRRAASTLSNLSRHPDNIGLYMRHEQRLLDLVMSQILDQGVASILSHVLFNIGIHSNERMKKTTADKAENNSINPIANPGKADIAAS